MRFRLCTFSISSWRWRWGWRWRRRRCGCWCWLRSFLPHRGVLKLCPSLPLFATDSRRRRDGPTLRRSPRRCGNVERLGLSFDGASPWGRRGRAMSQPTLTKMVVTKSAVAAWKTKTNRHVGGQRKMGKSCASWEMSCATIVWHCSRHPRSSGPPRGLWSSVTSRDPWERPKSKSYRGGMGTVSRPHGGLTGRGPRISHTARRAQALHLVEGH